jgi:alpha-aminoadipate/glutamate carrier protein LysW
MATCPSCEASDLEVDEYDLEEGEIITCPECGASLEVTSLSPLDFDVASDEDDDDDDEEDDDEDEDDDDEDEELDESEDDDGEREDWD